MEKRTTKVVAILIILLFVCLIMLLAVSGICIWNVTNPDKYNTAMLVEEQQILNEDQMVELTRKTVIVCANDEFDASDSNAVERSQSGNIWSLTYDSTKAAEEAYEMYSNDANVVFCEYDTTLKTQTLDDTDTYESNSDITKDSLVESHLEHTDRPEVYENILSSLDNETYEKTKKAVIVVIDSGATGSYENAYNAFDGSNDVTDTVGHGTQMISTITDMLSDYNGSYEIVPVKVANENGVGSITALIRAFEYASNLNATVVNLSLTSLDNADSYILEEYIAKFGHNGTVVVTSAGNFSDDTSNYVPAKFEDAIVVGSCDENGELASFSNYGTSVDWLVDSDSTSEAAAIMSSLYAKAYLDDVHPLEIMSESDVVYSYVYDAIPDEGQDVNHVSLYDETAYASSDLNLDRFVDKELWWCANYSCTCDEDSYTQYSCKGCASMNATITIKNTYGSGDVEVRVEQDTSSSNVKTIAYIKQNGTSNYPVGSENKEEGHITRHGKVTITNSGNDTVVKFINCDVAGVTPFIYILPNVRPGYTVSSIVPTGEASDYYTHYCKSGNKAKNGWHAGYVDYRNGGYYSYAGALNKTNEYTISYTANNYSVAYNANGGTGSMSNSSHTYDTAKNLTANSFTRTGYTFAGWNTKSNGTGTAYADKASVKNLTTTNNGTVTLYAQWKPISIKVTFYKNDGTSDTASQSFTYDATGTKKFGYKTDGTPLWTQTGQFGGWDRNGYILLGWAKSSTGEKAYSTYSDVANWWILENYSSINLYAVWTPKTTKVTFHKNDGTSDTATQLFTYAATGTKKFGYKTDGTPLWTQTGQFGSWNKTGWTLQGWSHTSTGEKAYSIYNDVEDWWINQYYSSKDLYGIWTPNTYTIAYNSNKPSSASNSVTGSTSSSSHTYDTAKTLTSNGYKLTGWTFTGWNTKADGSGTSYANKASVKNLTTTNGGTVTLYAQWVQNTLTIQFHASGGTSNSTTYYVGSDSLIYITESKKLRTTSWKYESASIDLYSISTFGLSKTGYHITSNDVAWLIGSASGSSITQNGTTATADLNKFKSLIANGSATVTLYVNWTPNTYTINYNYNKPSSASHNIVGSTDSSSHTYDISKALTSNGYKLTGWTFTGWNTKADGTGTSYSDGTDVLNWTSVDKKVITLYAQWKANTYTIVYDKNKPSNASHDVTGTMANSTYTYDVSSALRTNTYKLTGWTFTGWNTKADGTGTTYLDKANISNCTSADGTIITLYAQWRAHTYTIKYDKNIQDTASHDITGTMADSVYTYDIESKLRTNTYSLVGWTFTGWNTKADGSGTTYKDGVDVLNWTSVDKKVITLYAQWEANTYTINYDANNKSTTPNNIYGNEFTTEPTGTTNSTSATYDSTVKLATNGFSRVGYTFKGWNTQSDSKGTMYTSGQILDKPNFITGVSGNNSTTLYAIWEPITYTVKFDRGLTNDSKNPVPTTMTLRFDQNEKWPGIGDIKGRKYTLSFAVNKPSNATSTPNPSSVATRTDYLAYAGNWALTNADYESKVGYAGESSSSFKNLRSTPGEVTATAEWTPKVLDNYTALTLTGWKFNGWYTEKTGGNRQTTITVSGNTKEYIQTLYANWTANTYTVVYNSNKPSNASGSISGTMSNSSHTYDIDTPLNNNKYSLVGWSFVSWNTQADGKGKTVTTGYNLTTVDGGVVNLYAIWRAHTYTVNYHINKSEAGTYGGSTESSKHTYDTAKNLTANGYWVYNTITFDANKVTDSDGKGTTEVTLTKKSAAGYRKFIGWIQNKTTGDKTYGDKQSVINLTAVDNGVINMYAKWGTSKITLGSASRDGYTFSCWLDSNGNKYNANTEYEFTEDTTLYAQWVQNGYNIVYDKNDTVYNIYGDKVTTKATGSTPGTLAKFDDNVKLAANGFTKVGYKFKGWSLYKDWKTGDPADRLFESGATLKPGQFTGGTHTGGFTAYNGSTVTLYAIWEPITYEVRFNGNNNWNTSQGSYTQTLTYDKITALETNKFTRLDNTKYNGVFYKVGYEFLGWGKSQTQTTPTYTDRQEVFNLTATDGEIIDLYAIWRKTVTLTIDFNGGKFNNNAASEVLEYTMYNNELNHSFDIKKYYGTQKGLNYYSKGLNNNVTKTLSGVQQRFLGYSLSKKATIPDVKFDVYAVTTRTEDYIISDNTTLYAVYEPVLQMTVSLSTLESHLKEIKVDKDITIANELGNFIVLSGTINTSLPNNVTALTSNKAIGINVLNSGVVNYKVSAKGNSDITFKMTADNRILDIYTNGLDNIWYDNLNKVTDFNYTIEDFSSLENTFTIPKYLGTQRSYQTSNPNSSDNSLVYGIKFTCTQPSYYYRKYWNTDESISIYGILFLEPSEITGDNKADSDDMSQYSDFYLQTILN